MTKDMIMAELVKRNKHAKVKFFERSPYMAARYKEEFVTPEAWIYTLNSSVGQVITQEDFENEAYRKNFFDFL